MSARAEMLQELRDYQRWRSDRTDFDLLDYIVCVATPDALFGFLALLSPDLVQHDGNYFLASHFDPKTYDDWMVRLRDPVAVQKAVDARPVVDTLDQVVLDRVVAA